MTDIEAIRAERIAIEARQKSDAERLARLRRECPHQWSAETEESHPIGNGHWGEQVTFYKQCDACGESQSRDGGYRG